MKLLASTALMLLMAFAIAACGGDSTEAVPTLVPQGDDTTTETTEDTTTEDTSTEDSGNAEDESGDDSAADPSTSSDTLTLGNITVPNPGERWQVFEVDSAVGTLEQITSSNLLAGYTLNIRLTDKFGETLERNLRSIIGEDPEVLEENGVRYVEGEDFTLYVDVNDTFYATVTLTRSGDDPIEDPYLSDWREMAFNIEVSE